MRLPESQAQLLKGEPRWRLLKPKTSNNFTPGETSILSKLRFKLSSLRVQRRAKESHKFTMIPMEILRFWATALGKGALLFAIAPSSTRDKVAAATKSHHPAIGSSSDLCVINSKLQLLPFRPYSTITLLIVLESGDTSQTSPSSTITLTFAPVVKASVKLDIIAFPPCAEVENANRVPSLYLLPQSVLA